MRRRHGTKPRFSPVAGIQWVETLPIENWQRETVINSFSPVAGIQWVETVPVNEDYCVLVGCFSPVAGIQWVETPPEVQRSLFEERFSPVAGIQWVETSGVVGSNEYRPMKFQSRCRDSVG